MFPKTFVNGEVETPGFKYTRFGVLIWSQGFKFETSECNNQNLQEFPLRHARRAEYSRVRVVYTATAQGVKYCGKPRCGLRLMRGASLMPVLNDVSFARLYLTSAPDVRQGVQQLPIRPVS
jgi:hypothetical protein